MSQHLRRVAEFVVVVAMGAALTAGALMLLRPTPRAASTDTGTKPSAAPGERSHLGFTLADQDVNGLRLRPALASADKQTATIGESDGPGSDVVAELTVYEAGRYRRTPERGDEPVEVDGHAGFFGEGPSSFGRTPVPTVEWEYRPGAWAVLSGVKEPASTRKQLLAIAADVRLGEPYEARTPCRFGYLPAGLRAVSVSGAPTRQDAPPAHYQPFLRFVDDVPGDLDAWSMDADRADGAAIEVVFWAVGPVNGDAGPDSAPEDVGGYPGEWTSDQSGTRTAFVYLPGTIIVRVKVDARHLDAYPKSEIAHIVRELHCAPPQDLPSWPTVTEAVGR